MFLSNQFPSDYLTNSQKSNFLYSQKSSEWTDNHSYSIIVDIKRNSPKWHQNINR